MTTYYGAITSRIPTEATLTEEVRCRLGLHKWAKWEQVVSVVREGRREWEVISGQRRECVACGQVETRAV